MKLGSIKIYVYTKIFILPIIFKQKFRKVLTTYNNNSSTVNPV